MFPHSGEPVGSCYAHGKSMAHLPAKERGVLPGPGVSQSDWPTCVSLLVRAYLFASFTGDGSFLGPSR